MFMRGIVIAATAACALVAGCDQNPKSNDVTIRGNGGSVTISANGHNFTMKAADDRNGSFTMSADNGHFTMNASGGNQGAEIDASGNAANLVMPTFAAAYPGAKVQSTTIGSGTNGASGTITFETKDSPAAVIAFYKNKAADAGLAQSMDMDMGTSIMFGADAKGGTRALKVTAASSGGGAHVQVNWTGK